MGKGLAREMKAGRCRLLREAYCRGRRRVFEIKPILGKSVSLQLFPISPETNENLGAEP
jgi:hypothetical protein